MAGEETSTAPAQRMLADRYEVGELLGTGGMARVYRGRDHVLRRDVAIKLLDARSASDQRFLRLFVREARAAAGLVHSHAVTVFDTGVDGEKHFIVMELVEGETLRDLLAREGPLDPERARSLAAAIAGALAAAHERGLVHRDVKPGNVLLDPHGDPKVADFGIARVVDDDETSDVVLGTASTMSPEQAQGHPTTPSSDVYSLGCVLYEMLTGRPPFEGDHPLAVATRHMHEAPAPVESLRPGIPVEVAEVAERALRKQPDERFPDASEMLAALEAAAPAAELPPPLAPRPRRRLRSWVAAAAVLVLMVAIAPVLFRTSSPGAPDRARAVDAGPVEVPEVIGLSEDEAARRLREAGVVPELRGGALDDGILGVIVGQDPEPGTRVKRGSTVTLEVDVSGGGSQDEGEVEREEAEEEAEENTKGKGSGSSEAGDTSDDVVPTPTSSPTSSPTPSPTSSHSPSPTTTSVADG